jgi:acyl carrier protein
MRVRDQIADWLVERVAATLTIEAATVRYDVAFTDLGVSSLQAVELSDDLQRLTNLTLPPTLVFDHPTIDGAAAFVAGELARGKATLPALGRSTR